ncbi:hypothetical protein D3C85_1477450 [compost metagenome]
MTGRGLVQARGFLRAFAFGFGRLFAGGLCLAHIGCRGEQDRLRVIAQCRAVQRIVGADGIGKCFPFINDTIYVLHNEFR